MEPLSQAVLNVVSNWPKPAQCHFDTLRTSVHDAAKAAKIVTLTETLKWNEPARLPEKVGLCQRCAQVGPPNAPTRWVYSSTLIRPCQKRCAFCTQRYSC